MTRLLTISETAQQLSVGDSTVRRWIKAGFRVIRVLIEARIMR